MEFFVSPHAVRASAAVARASFPSKTLLLSATLLGATLLSGCDSGMLEPDALYPETRPAELLLNTVSLDLAAGDTFRLETTFIGSDGKVLGRSGSGFGGVNGAGKLTWTSSNPDAVEVDEFGLIRALTEGDAVVTVGSGTLVGASSVKVNGKGKGIENGNGKGPNKGDTSEPGPAPATIEISPDHVKIVALDESVQLENRVLDSEGTEISEPSIVWSSENPEIASVDGAGRVISRAVGMAAIVAVSGSVADTARVEVVQEVATISVSPTAPTIGVGDTVRLSAAAFDANGNPIESASLSWSSSDAGIVSVGGSGLAKGVAQGAATISASASNGAKGSTEVTVQVASSVPTDPGTTIKPGDDIQAKVDAAGAGARFTLLAGVHRLQQIRPRDGQQFIGEPGAVLSGARLLTEFGREGGYYVATGQTQQGQVHGSCERNPDGSSYSGCTYPEDLFIDDRMLTQVTSLSEVGSGRWYFDYNTDKVYFADDPRGRKVEIGVTRHAFYGSARNVTIRNLTIEKYANPAQSGAIHGNDSSDWIVEQNVIRWNHGVGLRLGNRMRVADNQVLSNGQLGIGGSGTDVIVERNRIAYNNIARYKIGWEAGGTKFVKTNRLIVRDNHVHDNFGPGLWTDIDNIYTLYEGNLVENNHNSGIFHEISYDAVIRNNTVRGNGFGYSDWLWGAGIQVANSPNVEVYGNTVTDNANGIIGTQQNRGAGAHGEWLLRNLKVHDNTIRMTSGRSGIGVDNGDAVAGAPEGGNRFQSNRYYVDSRSSSRWHWTVSGGRLDWNGWQEVGNDTTGQVSG